MKEALSDILNSYNGMVSDKLVANYIQGKASTEEVRHLEHLMLEDPFLADAIEGLKQGDWSVHENNIQQIHAALPKVKPNNTFRISMTSAAIAASVVLVTYFGFEFIGIQKEKDSNVATNAKTVQKHTHISTIREAKEVEETQKIETQTGNNKPLTSQQAATATYYFKDQDSTTVMLSLQKQEEPLSPKSKEGSNMAGNYISKDKSFDKKSSVIIDDAELAEEDELTPMPMAEASAGAEARQLQDMMIPLKSSAFEHIAVNTKHEIGGGAELKESKKAKSSSYKKESSSLYAKPKCNNCPDKEAIAEKNMIADTIAIHKAQDLYEQGVYADAAKWYYRQSDVNSKIMAGLSYLQAADTVSCKLLEMALAKTNINASIYLKALRLSYEGQDEASAAQFQKLIDNNSPFKELSLKNQKAIFTK